MKKLILCLIIGCEVMQSSLSAYEMNSTCSLACGYRQDELQWDMSMLPIDNVITKQKWHDIQIFQLAGACETLVENQFYIRGEGDYGWIQGGKKAFDEIDLDQISTSSDDGWLVARTRGYVYDVSGAMGYQWNFDCDHIQVRPLVGYAYHMQKFRDKHYHDKIHLFNLFDDVSSKYKYQWKGPWIGIHLGYLWDCELRLFAEYQFHWDCFRSKIVDNLIPGSAFERQKASNVKGQDISLGISYACFSQWEIALHGNYKYWASKKGSVKVEDDHFKLKNLHWKSLSILADISYQF